MKIKITEDKNNIIEQIFQEESYEKYNYLDTNLLLCFLYNRYVTWKYDRNENKFYISDKDSLLNTLNIQQWKAIFKDNKIKIDKETNYIFITALEHVANKFLEFLELNGVEFKKRNYKLNF